MTPTIKLLITLLASPLVILIIHSAVTRSLAAAGKEAPNQVVCAACLLLGYIPVGILVCYFTVIPLYASGEAWLPAALYAFLVYSSIGYIYFHVFNMTETARRIRIMTELASRGPMKTGEIVEAYDDGHITDVRIERLLSMGQIKEVEGRYRLGGRFLYLVALLLHYWGSLIGYPLRGRRAS